MQKKKNTPINNQINATEIMLIDNSGVKKGVMPIEDALKAAQDVDMDLVQVSNNDAKPVQRINQTDTPKELEILFVTIAAPA